MTLLDRHIFRSALATCLAAIAVFAFVLITGNVVRDLIEPGMAGQLTWDRFLRLTLLLIPFVISYALPMGMLTGVLLTLGRLSADNEITAMRAAGVSLKRIAAPVLVLGGLGAAVAVPINFRSMPWARVQYDRELSEAIRANPLKFIIPRTFIRDFPNTVIYVGERRGHELRDIWAWKLDEQRRVRSLLHATSGTVDYDPAAFELILSAKEGQQETLDETNPESFREARPTVATVEHWDPYHLALSGIFTRPAGRQKLQWMTYRQLLREKARRAGDAAIKTAGERARQVMQVSMTMMDKLSTAMAVFTFAFVAVPLGIKVSRRETSANLGMGVALALGYYLLTVALGQMNRRPDFRPDLLLWLPNLAFLIIGVRLFLRIDPH